MIYTVKGFCQI